LKSKIIKDENGISWRQYRTKSKDAGDFITSEKITFLSRKIINQNSMVSGESNL